MNQSPAVNVFLDTLPSATRELLISIVDNFHAALGKNLVGIYLHGSLAMGCFNPISSDVDFIVVVNQPLNVEAKKKIATVSLQLAENAPPKGLEFSIVLLSAAQHFTYPTPFEFHYSQAWHERYRTGQVDFEAQASDADLAAHFTIIRHRGIVLQGASIEKVFSEVPAQYYLASIAEDCQWSYQNVMNGADAGECSVPTYAVLNFCRVLAFIKHRAILSKLEGGEWALKNLSQTYVPIIQAALKTYTANKSDPVDCALLKQLAIDAMTIINQIVKS